MPLPELFTFARDSGLGLTLDGVMGPPPRPRSNASANKGCWARM